MANESINTSDLGAAVSGLAEGRKVFNSRYTLIRIVGRGPHSVVWLGWDEHFQRDACLKFLPEATKPDASALANFKREVRKLQEFKNPILVSLYEVEEEGPLVAISMEYVEGHTLTELRASQKSQILPQNDLANYVGQTCGVLEKYHAEGHVHGDLNPSNLMVSQKGAFRITDFALTKVLQEYFAKVVPDRPLNQRLNYQSPQQAKGEPVNFLDDIYSLGATICESLTSKPPFYTGDIMLQVQQKIPPPMTHRRKELRVIGEPVPRVWEETIAACLSKNPAQRPQSISQVMEALGVKAAPTVEEIAAAAAAATAATVAPAPAGSNKMMMVAAVAGLVVLALLGLVLGKSGTKTTTVVTKVDDSQVKAAEKKAAEAAKKAQSEIERMRKDSEKAQKDAVAKQKQFEEQSRLLEQQREKAKQDEAKRLALEATRVKEADEARKKAEAEAARQAAETKRLTEEFAKAKKAAEAAKTGTATSAEAQKALKEAEDKSRKADEAAKKAMADREKAIKEQADLLKKAEADRLATEAKTKQLTMQLEQAKKAGDQEKLRAEADARARALLILEQEAKEKAKKDAEEARKAAELKKKQEDEAKKMALLSEKAKQEAEAKRMAEAEARKFKPGKPWENSLFMRLVPVGSVLVGVNETRVDDYDDFVNTAKYDAGQGWKSPGFKQTGSHPVVGVSWNDAQAFCKWLTEKERKEGLIGNASYRLPTDAEWSQMAKLEGESGATPADKDAKVRAAYPWGATWPPPMGAGNYANNVSFDEFDETAPVASFRPNAFGLYDLGGNAAEWVQDWADGTQKARAVRGGSWSGYVPGSLFSSRRRAEAPGERANDVGFRLVLDPSGK
jgi:formylglycine-generating enzyme required for sulfatase activity